MEFVVSKKDDAASVRFAKEKAVLELLPVNPAHREYIQRQCLKCNRMADGATDKQRTIWLCSFCGTMFFIMEADK